MRGWAPFFGLFIHLPIPSPIHLPMHPSTYPLIHPSILPFIHHSSPHPLLPPIYSSTHRPSTHPSTHPLIYPLIYPLTHPPTHPLIHCPSIHLPALLSFHPAYYEVGSVLVLGAGYRFILTLQVFSWKTHKSTVITLQHSVFQVLRQREAQGLKLPEEGPLA